MKPGRRRRQASRLKKKQRKTQRRLLSEREFHETMSYMLKRDMERL